MTNIWLTSLYHQNLYFWDFVDSQKPPASCGFDILSFAVKLFGASYF